MIMIMFDELRGGLDYEYGCRVRIQISFRLDKDMVVVMVMMSDFGFFTYILFHVLFYASCVHCIQSISRNLLSAMEDCRWSMVGSDQRLITKLEGADLGTSGSCWVTSMSSNFGYEKLR
jgi:hypothetical protein